jgi:ABC-type dipeptide/oligopeptide/nickel transport system permease component
VFNFVFRRILLTPITLLAVFTIVFIVLRVAPGDPAAVVLGSFASEQALKAVRSSMGLDKPLYVQYFESLGNLVKGDLGRSLINNAPVAGQIKRVLPFTLDLVVAGTFISLIIGIPLGVLSAVKRNRWVDYVGRSASLAGLSTPSFLLGILAIWALSLKLPVFPTLGGGESGNLTSRIYHLALPSIALGLIQAAFVSRMTRSSLLNILQEDYIRTARAKGLDQRMVIFKHALGSCLIPIITLVGLYVGILIADSVLIEVVFNRPGLGKLMVGSVKNRDYIMVQSIMTIYAIMVVIINLVTDITYGLVDPRVKYQ